MPSIDNAVHEPQQPWSAAEEDQDNTRMATPPAKATPDAPPNQKARWERSKGQAMRQPHFS